MSPSPHSSATCVKGSARRSVKLFISYSHQNKVWMERLIPLLDGFRYDARLAKWPRLQYLHAWHDKEIMAGSQWDTEIKQELEEMDVFVPLVSIHYFGSWYIQNVEHPRAQIRYAAGEISVVPIMLYDVNLREKCPFLYNLTPLPTADRWWSNFPDVYDAHRLIDDGLWGAIADALKRKPLRST